MTNEKVTLPLLPLKSGVILPGMVFTMALESDEARVAVEAARSAGGQLLLVPHIDGRYATVGVIAEVVEEGSLPGGLEAIVIRGERRATIGTGVPGTGDALWVEAEPLDDGEVTPNVTELAREYRAVLENILLSRGARQIASQLREITEPGRLADVAGYSPDLALAQKVQVLETIDVESRLNLVLGWARDTLADLTLRDRIKNDVEEGMEKTQREFLLRRQSTQSRRSWVNWATTTTSTPMTIGPRSPTATYPITFAPRYCERSTNSIARTTRVPRPAGSAPGSTPSSNSPGASSPTIDWTSSKPNES